MIRWAVVAEMVTLLWSVSLLQGFHGKTVPRDVRWMMRALLSVVVLVAVAVIVNNLTGAAATPGAFVIAAGVLPATVAGVWLSVRAALSARRVQVAWEQERDGFVAMVDGLAHAEPCADPNCMTARAEMQAIAKRITSA